MTHTTHVRDTGTWRKSSYSNADGGHCLEVAVHASTTVPIRDSKDLTRGELAIPARSWATLTTTLKADR